MLLLLNPLFPVKCFIVSLAASAFFARSRVFNNTRVALVVIVSVTFDTRTCSLPERMASMRNEWDSSSLRPRRPPERTAMQGDEALVEDSREPSTPAVFSPAAKRRQIWIIYFIGFMVSLHVAFIIVLDKDGFKFHAWNSLHLSKLIIVNEKLHSVSNSGKKQLCK